MRQTRTMKRLFVERPLDPRSTCTLDAESAHYLGRVLRARVGDTLTVFDRDGRTGAARISHLGKRSAALDVGELTIVDDRSQVRVVLLQALSRAQKIDLVIQKAVELGVDEVIPIATERSAMKVDDVKVAHKLAHWTKVAIGACQQSGRVRLPEIHPPQTLDAALGEISADVQLVALPDATTSLREVLNAPAPKCVAVLIGPEGGFSDSEIRLCADASFTPVRAGDRVLRTETAAIALLSVIQFAWGDLS